MRLRTIIILFLSLLLLAVSYPPMFNMSREMWTDARVSSRYVVDHAYVRDGFPHIIDQDSIEWKGHLIEIKEQDTGRDAPQTHWDLKEGVPGGDIVSVQIMLNGEAIGEPVEMWLSNRQRGSRYFSWLDVLKVSDQVEHVKTAAVVQRLTDDDTRMDDRRWRILHIAEDGSWREEEVSYRERSSNHLAVRLIRVSGTRLMAMGYYSDTLHYYPSLLFPLLYPWGSTAVGVLMLVIGGFLVRGDLRAKRRS